MFFSHSLKLGISYGKSPILMTFVLDPDIDDHSLYLVCLKAAQKKRDGLTYHLIRSSSTPIDNQCRLSTII